jgi:YaiO family outer membrane protein
MGAGPSESGTVCSGGVVWVLLALSAAGAAAQELPPVDVEAGATREVLSGDQAPWEEYWIRATIRPGPATFVYGGVRHTRRFGHEDQQLEAGGGLPLAERWGLLVEGTWSPTHRVLPIWGLAGRLTHTLTDRWSIYGGGGRQVWEPTGANHQHVGVAHHYRQFRVGYTLGFHQIDTGGSGIRHTVDGSWVYDQRGSQVTLVLGTGRQSLIVGPGDIRSIQEQSAWVTGAHWLDDRTGIGYTFGVHRHGDFFTRTTSSIGFRHRL